MFLEKDTFKVSRLKELIMKEIGKKMHSSNYLVGSRTIRQCLQRIDIGQEKYFDFKHIKFETSQNCQILQVNGKGWQKGKLNIEICISLDTNNSDKVNLELFPEEPIQTKSPLDDIREMIQAN